MVAATCVAWLTVAVRKVATRCVPGLLAITALVLTLETALVIATGAHCFSCSSSRWPTWPCASCSRGPRPRASRWWPSWPPR